MSDFCPLSRDPQKHYLPTTFARFLISVARSGARNIGGFSERRLRGQLRRAFHRPNISPDSTEIEHGQDTGPRKSTPAVKKRKRIAPMESSSSDEYEEHDSDEEPIFSSEDEDRQERDAQPKGKGKGKGKKSSN